MRRIAGTDLEVFPLCLGGNVFGWTADERESVAVLDRYIEVGGNFIDTADLYAGGESEAIIGRWMLARANRDWLVIATKVGMAAGLANLRRETILTAADRSLERLQTDHIDLYYAHRDDPATPVEETLGAFDELVRAGKVTHIGASNYGAPRLAEALAASDREGIARFVAVQPHYNLVERGEYEGELAEPVRARGSGVPAVLRPGEGLPHGQVPAGIAGGREPARRPGRGPTSTSGASPCSGRSTRSRGRTGRAWRRSPSPGWRGSRRSWRRSRARGRRRS